MAGRWGSDVKDIYDCSIYPEVLTVNGEQWYFESMSGGQHDTREEMAVYTDKEAYDMLHAFWDAYHLQKVDDGVIKTVEQLAEDFEAIDTVTWIGEFIEGMED